MLPEMLFGSASVMAISFGLRTAEILCLQNAFVRRAQSPCSPSRGTITAFTASPRVSSGTPITATAWTHSHSANISSNSRQMTRSPPTFRAANDCQHAVLQDLVHVLSGQGVPPPDLKSWRMIYRAAACSLKKAHEFHEPGLDWFIHRVGL
jgi:hypothetical protein